MSIVDDESLKKLKLLADNKKEEEAKKIDLLYNELGLKISEKLLLNTIDNDAEFLRTVISKVFKPENKNKEMVKLAQESKEAHKKKGKSSLLQFGTQREFKL